VTRIEPKITLTKSNEFQIYYLLFKLIQRYTKLNTYVVNFISKDMFL